MNFLFLIILMMTPEFFCYHILLTTSLELMRKLAIEFK